MSFLLEKGAEKLLLLLLERITSVAKGYKQEPDRVEQGIEKHLRFASAWSAMFQLHGMPEPAGTEDSTIELSMDSQARQFRSRERAVEIRTEADLLAGGGHYLLLGEPGSGKTTTIRRLVRRVLLDHPVSAGDEARYPVVVLLRDIPPGQSLCEHVANAIGLVPKTVEIKRRVAVDVDRRGKPIYEEQVHTERRLGDEMLQYALPEILARTQALLFLDGIDELRAGERDDIISEINQLGARMGTSRIIASSRTGDYSYVLEGFSVVEILPLTVGQVREIATKWLTDAGDFMNSLKRLTYSELADRPLFLTKLLFLYQRDGALPVRPASVYSRVIRLMLEEWDRERNVKHVSKYSGFDADRKLEFLSALAYHLTYRLQQKVFREIDLIRAYGAVHEAFELPVGEALRVAKEIQSHTGIVMEGPDETFEFSHLTLQEFLCAQYLVRMPLPASVPQELAAYSAPLAVSIAIASDSALSLARLVLGAGNFSELKAHGVRSLIFRVVQEAPHFDRSSVLGAAMLKLFQVASQPDWLQAREAVARLVDYKNVLESVADALSYYTVVLPTSRSAICSLEASSDAKFPIRCDFRVPPRAAIPLDVLARALQHLPYVTARTPTRGLRRLSVGEARELAQCMPSWIPG